MVRLIILLILPQLAYSSIIDNKFINQEIKSFYTNPVEYYQKPLVRFGHTNQSTVNLNERIKIRKKIIKNEAKVSQKSVIQNNDRASRLLRDIYIESNINELDKLGIQSGETKVAPWSDDYWAIFKGVLGARYGDEEFGYLDSWKESFDYIQSNPAISLFKTGSSSEINKLSPSEKFDFLVGNKMNLTDRLWAQGKRYADRSETGEVETWMGICHGWAPASYLVPRPRKSIEVLAHDGVTPIQFYPSDLKALASLLWASTSYPTNFIGGRCRSSQPQRDPDGRIVDKSCSDNNPATFFLSTLNGVGVHGKSFVMDITNDYEVWNQPIRSYKYTLFNPTTQNTVNNLKDGIIELSDYKNDPFKKYRAKKAKYIVGVSMEVSYGVETAPDQQDINSEEHDEFGTIFLMFDLELDEHFNIIGGEWYSEDFPDFLWKPSEDANAYTNEDYYVLSRPLWDGKNKIESDIALLAKAAAKDGSPLAYIVNSLIKLAQ